jgi:uncharacterized protein (TIGR03067 family)
LALETLVRAGAATTKAKPKAKKSARRGGAAVQPGAAEPSMAEPHGPTTELEGEWAMVAAVFNGVAMPEHAVQWCRRKTRGDVTMVIAGPNVMLEARYTLDRTSDPWTIDYVNLSGTNAGKAQSGIVLLVDDMLQISMAAPGKPRPTGFDSIAGDGRSYTAWRRLS